MELGRVSINKAHKGSTGKYKTHRKEKHMNETKLLSIFGAKVSKDGTKLVLTLVCGEDESKQFYNACIKLDNSQKTHAKVEKGGKHALIKVVMLENKQPKAETNAEDMPF